MSDKPISDRRGRILADMTIRTFSDKTQREYIRHRRLPAHLGKTRTQNG